MVKKEHSNIREAQKKKEIKGEKKLFDTETFGENLKKAREGHYTREELAEEARQYGDVALSPSTIKACEHGKGNISAQALYVLSDIFDKPMDEFVSRNFKIENKKNNIGQQIGLTDKSVKFLKEKKKDKDRNKNTISRVKIINDVTFHLNEIDAVNYLLENSNIFSIFIRDAKRIYCELYELEKAENLKIDKLKNMYIDFCKSKKCIDLQDKKQMQIYSKLYNTENAKKLNIKELKKLYTNLYKLEKNKETNKEIKNQNEQHYRNTQQIEREIIDIRQKHEDFINYSSFSMYSSINKNFRKYIKKLKSENKK